MSIKDEYPRELALVGFWLPTEHWIEINETRIEEIEAKSTGRFPSYAYNFKLIRQHWQKLQTHENAIEYLEHMKGKWEYDKETFITNLMSDIGALAFFEYPIPPEGSKEDKEL